METKSRKEEGENRMNPVDTILVFLWSSLFLGVVGFFLNVGAFVPGEHAAMAFVTFSVMRFLTVWGRTWFIIVPVQGLVYLFMRFFMAKGIMWLKGNLVACIIAASAVPGLYVAERISLLTHENFQAVRLVRQH